MLIIPAWAKPFYGREALLCLPAMPLLLWASLWLGDEVQGAIAAGAAFSVGFGASRGLRGRRWGAMLAATLHFIHGKSDEVVPYGHTVAAAERLVRLGGDITADVIPFLGHTVNEEVVELLVERLKGHIPKRFWEQAGHSAPP